MKLNNLNVAVTGATGFIGRYICAELLRRQACVFGVVRNPDRVPELVAQGVTMRQADLTDRTALGRAFDGIDVVVSNAALFDLDNGNWQDHEQTNIEGGRNVLQAALAAGVKRVILVSSCGIYAGLGRGLPAENGEQLSAKSWRHRGNRYMVSKALAEQDAWAFSREQGVNLTAVRPSAVYGAHDTNFMPRMLKMAGQSLSLPYVRFSLVYAGDVADAICNCIADDTTIGKSYNASGEDRKLDDFLAEVREAYGIKARMRVPLPVPFRNTFDCTMATREIGFSNRSYAQGLADTQRLENMTQ
jgi:dihydroflavonol-4-reductase